VRNKQQKKKEPSNSAGNLFMELGGGKVGEGNDQTYEKKGGIGGGVLVSRLECSRLGETDRAA